jgi:predicted amidophosphoribosyltransferase
MICSVCGKYSRGYVDFDGVYHVYSKSDHTCKDCMEEWEEDEESSCKHCGRPLTEDDVACYEDLCGYCYGKNWGEF